MLFKAGTSRDGYFTHNNIISQFEKAVTLAYKLWPEDCHVFVYDNAKTHSKHADGALSARKMPRNVPKDDGNWYVQVNVIGDNGKPLYGPDRKLIKQDMEMGPGTFRNRAPQSFYFPPGHKHAGKFKGMTNILAERGHNVGGLKAQCGSKFSDCEDPGPNARCCCQRILFNEPDFVAVKSLLELRAEELGTKVIFLPKFHPELNPIEQCWGAAKRVYRKFPALSKEADLEKNVISALNSVTVLHIRRFHNRALCF